VFYSEMWTWAPYYRGSTALFVGIKSSVTPSSSGGAVDDVPPDDVPPDDVSMLFGAGQQAPAQEENCRLARQQRWKGRMLL
jgi:hypothetical protein